MSYQKVSPQQRRENSNKKIKNLGIICFEELPMLESSSEVKLKSLDEICKRAVASLLCVQLALDLSNEIQIEDVDDSQVQTYTEEERQIAQEITEQIFAFLKMYDVENDLLDVEKALFDLSRKPNDRQIVHMIWNYEAYWSLVWALGLIDDISYPTDICDCQKAIDLVVNCENFEEFKANCKLRDIEEILDMLDLHYRFHWAVVENRLHPEKSIGELNPDVVWERRKGLEWLVSEENDWDMIALHT